MKSTPVSAIARTVSRLTPPEASRVGLPPVGVGVAQLDRGAQRRRVHVVEQQLVGAGAERVGGLVEVVAPRPRSAARGGPCGPRRPPSRCCPAAAMWFSLIRKASKRPIRWLVPPPAATAAFSSLRRPGVVLRVSRIRALGAGDRLDVAGGQRRHPGEVAEEVQRGALGGEERAGGAAGDQHLGRARPGATRPRRPASRPPPPRTGAIVSATRSSPKTTPGAFWTIRARRGRLGRDRRLAGDVAVAEVLGQRPGDQLAHLLGGNCGHHVGAPYRERRGGANLTSARLGDVESTRWQSYRRSRR